MELPRSQPWHCVRVPRTPLCPVRAARTHPGTGCPGTEDRAQAGARCQAPCPGSAREELLFHLWAEEGEEPGCSQSSRCRPRGSQCHQQAVHAALQSSLSPCPLARSCAPPAAPMGPSGRRLFCTHTCSPSSCAQSRALTLLAGLQLLHFQVMGELWKRNPAGLRRSIPPFLCSPCVPLLPLGHWTSLWLQ